MNDVSLRYYVNPGERWGEVIMRQPHCEEVHFPWDSQKDYIYNEDPNLLIRYKSLIMSVITPISCTVLAIYNLTIAIFRTLFQRDRYNLKAVWADVIRPLVYLLPMEGAALLGLVAPLNGRRIYSSLVRKILHPEHLVEIPHFFAPCFQPLFRKDANHHHHPNDLYPLGDPRNILIRYRAVREERLVLA